ncbi:hypothetical protein [Maricaulis parjimensis]|uniref:hypothetical protein n=1 Tax=Maricaulis parjimensis TaxID=144023 RepID=UPI001939BA6B|nr:hypothetical protein [Maricaulis parjimensis]
MIVTTMAMAILLQGSAADILVENALEISTSAGSYITYFNEDGTYTTTIGVEGTWWLEGSDLCVQRSTGEGGCQPLQEGLGLGDTWDAENPTMGVTVTYTIVPRG